MASGTPKSTRVGTLSRLFESAVGHTGHFTTPQARELGYSARSVPYHVAAGHFERASHATWLHPALAGRRGTAGTDAP